MNLVRELSKLPSKCVYALVNRKHRKVYISYTTNMITALARVLNELKYNHNLAHFKLVILEEIKHNSNLRLRLDYWVKRFEKKRWFYLRSYKKIVYKPRIEVMRGFKSESSTSAYIALNLVTSRSKRITVGVFDNIAECEQFKRDHYSKEVKTIIYADNELTKEYLNKNEY